MSLSNSSALQTSQNSCVGTCVKYQDCHPYSLHPTSRHYSNWYVLWHTFSKLNPHKCLSIFHGRKESQCVGGIPEGSIRSTGMKQEKQVAIQNAAVQQINWAADYLDYCVRMCERDAAHLLLAVKVAARAMPGSLFFRPVGESTLPVLRELECKGKALGWSSLKKGDIHLNNNDFYFSNKTVQS